MGGNRCGGDCIGADLSKRVRGLAQIGDRWQARSDARRMLVDEEATRRKTTARIVERYNDGVATDVAESGGDYRMSKSIGLIEDLQFGEI